MKGIIQPARGRPSKVVKNVATPRGRPIRRGGPSDSLSNQDPDLEPHDVDIDDDDKDHQQQQIHQHQHDHHADFDPETAAAAAAAAAHQHQQHQHQQQQQQLDLTAASILASSVQGNPIDQHPDLGDPHVEGEAGPHTTESYAQQSGYDNVIVESALAKRLSREPGMRHAQQRRPEQALNLQRRSNVEALFAHIAGELAPVPCKNCHKGHGPWNSCVIVDGQMCGSCANCWFNASGARCSFHETRNPNAHGGQVMGGDNIGFQMAPAPPAAMAPFNFVSIPASSDPVVRYTVEQAMAQVRGADKKSRNMLMVEAAARQLAFQIVQYEDSVQEEQNQQGAQQAVMSEQDAP
ncbi:Uu.00g004160.m01.CDS01 [Anthostomella pinea]|uniref:Uu.00g004160.m01.CDS01 n=1 Tax=Anthostomella pinea TaxID=933095 RepID=A0AAI8YIN8_9PEZI|nr:Uu.00g004160.m01.CDS01 [Anthostomella pinea]